MTDKCPEPFLKRLDEMGLPTRIREGKEDKKLVL